MKSIQIAGFLLLGVAAFGQNTNPLNIPPFLTGDTFNLVMAPSSHQFYPNITTQTFGFNGDYLGPTMIWNKGDSVWINVTNNLGEVATVHWHGLHVSGQNDGGPQITIPDGTTWSPSFPVLNDASTCWYHPHTHENTAPQVNKGLAGMIIIKDTVESQLNLPRTYGTDDFPIIIQDRSFDAQGNFLIDALADSVLVNGTAHPYLDLPAQVVRLRLLNGSNARTYNVGFSDNRTFYVIASDGGLIAVPHPVTRLRITNGERYEILVDLTNDNIGDSVYLMAYNSTLANNEPGGGGMPNGNSPLNATNFNILQLNVMTPTSSPVTTIPASLITLNPWNPAAANRTRTKAIQGMGMFDMGNFNINGDVFDMMVINDTIMLNDIEVWQWTNNSNVAHPIHIHDVVFYITSRNGNPPAPYEAGKKDVFYIKPGETVEFITKFEFYTTDSAAPYMYHCHNLHHEDMGMMLQFIVVNITAGVDPSSSGTIDYSVYPNPARESWQLKYTGEENISASWILTDVTGRIVSSADGIQLIPGGNMMISCENEKSGIYFLSLTTDKGSVTVKLIRQ
ncbi:MAG: multicopper oxidase domain-containing protein [Bacteroidia bacterium]